MIQAPPTPVWGMMVPLAHIQHLPAGSGVYEIYENVNGQWVKRTRGATTDLATRLNQHRLAAQRLNAPRLFVRWAHVAPAHLSAVEQSIPMGTGDQREAEMELGGRGGGFGPAATALARQRQFTEPVSGRWTRRRPGVIVIHLGPSRVALPR